MRRCRLGGEDDDFAEEAYGVIADGLKKAGIKLFADPCQEKSTSTTRQLNLLYSFSTWGRERRSTCLSDFCKL
ncbi:hypothetical protein SAMN00790413_05014 [Deinococcus hopiensis KR-140]|uniref:Uncharacterized protein n=1 Tax=Deinococcus hopiensis KR-140 TaxID=695939 RepID=A0A1W1USY5_9DEIO|nr:hypothetical protein SAMN00790413_05014 [Deinococcus hopiensis KR-140]